MAALKQALPVALSTAILSSTLLLTAVAYTNYPQVAIQHAAGYLCMLAGGLSVSQTPSRFKHKVSHPPTQLSSALAVLLTEEGIDIVSVTLFKHGSGLLTMHPLLDAGYALTRPRLI